MAPCTLCGLPAPESPVTAADVDGAFCCEGCLQVHRALADVDDVDADDVTARARSDEGDRTVPDGAAETFLGIDGMHCSTCEGFLAAVGERDDGILTVEASYATDTARVVYDPDVVAESDLADALSGYGYVAYQRDGDGDRPARRRDHDLMQRLLVGGFFSMLIMPWYVFYLYPSYVGIETGILDVDATSTVGVMLPLVMIGLMTSVVLFYTGYPVLRGAYVSLRVGAPNMDLLVSLAAVAAYAYSTVALAMGSTHLYYDVSVAVIMVVTVGTVYERRIKRRSTERLSDLTAARSSEATRLDGGETEIVPVGSLEPGDEVVVRPGERVPIDGTIVEGTAAVDESVLTGESLPVTRTSGEEVVGGSIVTDSALVVEVGEDAESTLDRIATLLWEIQSESPGIQRFADKLATIFVPLVVTLATVVTAYRLATGTPAPDALLTGLTVLVVSCPCAMGLATPLAVASGLRDALDRGIVVTNAALFESAPSVETLVFDKTGTLTRGQMDVRSTHGDRQAVELAAAVEQFSEHPAATAITDFVTRDRGPEARVRSDGGVAEVGSTDASGAEDAADVRGVEDVTGVTDEGDAADGITVGQGGDKTTCVVDTEVELGAVTDFRRHPGEGVSGVIDGRRVVVGTPDLVERLAGPLPESLAAEVTEGRDAGHLPVVIGYDGRARGVVVVGDCVREEWTDAVDGFDDRELVILTGDDERAAERFRDHPSVDRVFAGVPPGWTGRDRPPARGRRRDDDGRRRDQRRTGTGRRRPRDRTRQRHGPGGRRRRRDRHQRGPARRPDGVRPRGRYPPPDQGERLLGATIQRDRDPAGRPRDDQPPVRRPGDGGKQYHRRH